MNWAEVLRSLGISGSLLAIGVYLTAVADVAVSRLTAGVPPRLGEALVLPARRAALLLLEQPTRTERPDAALWMFSPALLAGIAAGTLSMLPLGPRAHGEAIASGIVYFGALMALVMVAVYLHGWSANSVFPLIGAYRFVALALSYEMPLALVLIGAALPAQSLAIDDIVRSQSGLWNVVRQPLGLPLYLVAALGLASRGPLNVADAEDLAGGTAAETAGMDRLLWRAAQNAILVAVAAMGAAVFLGGWLGPWLPGPAWMVLKTFALMVVLLLASHLIPRVRVERFVVVAWVILIPAALVDVFAAGVLALAGARS